MRPTLVLAAVALLFSPQPAKAFHHHTWHGAAFVPTTTAAFVTTPSAAFVHAGVPSFVSPSAAFVPAGVPSFVSPSAAFVPSMASTSFVTTPSAAFVPTAGVALMSNQTSAATAGAAQASAALSLGDVQTILSIVERLANLRSPQSPDSGQLTALSDRVGRLESRMTAVEARLTVIEARLGITSPPLTGTGDSTIPVLPPGDRIPFPSVASPAAVTSQQVEASLDHMESRYAHRRHWYDRLTEAQKKELEADYKYLADHGRKDRVPPPPKR